MRESIKLTGKKIHMSINKIKSKLKAYSLVEVLVAMSIVTIIIVMLTDTLLISLDVAVKSFARSNTREEQNNIITKIEKDIRNSRFVETCSGTDSSAVCTVALDNFYTWKYCTRQDGSGNICKVEYDASGNEILVDSFSEDVIVDKFVIEGGFSEAPAKTSILITIVVHHKNPRFEISNQIRQVLISTRNYEYL